VSCNRRLPPLAQCLARQLAQKFALVHTVFKSLVPVDKHDRHLIIKLSPQFAVAIHIYFGPSEAAAARELNQTLLHHLAKMTTFTRVDHDLARLGHAAIVPLFPNLLARKKNASIPVEWSYHFRIKSQE